MKNLLVIHSSARVRRSVTRRLASEFATGWTAARPDSTVVVRDVGTKPPPAIDEAWIAAAFAAETDRTPEQRASLATSDTLVRELESADAIVLGVPLYNFGMPGALKIWIDQIVRFGRTFVFDPSAQDPYRPLLPPKPVLAIVSAGDGDLHPGGPLAHLNFLEPHLRTVFAFIGLTDVSFVRVGYDEYKDDRWRQSVAEAEDEIQRRAREWPNHDARTS